MGGDGDSITLHEIPRAIRPVPRESGTNLQLSGIRRLIHAHIVLTIVFFIFVILWARHVDDKWTFALDKVEQRANVVKYVLGSVFAVVIGLLFIHATPLFLSPNSHSGIERSRVTASTALGIAYFVLLVVLQTTAPRVMTIRTEPRTISRFGEPTYSSRFVLRHNDLQVRATVSGMNDRSFSNPSADPNEFYARRVVQSQQFLQPALPEGSFNGSATRFNVNCFSVENPRFTINETHLDAIDDFYVTMTGTYDVEGRGSIEFTDLLYWDPFSGSPYGQGFYHDIGWDAPHNTFVRFPKTFNTSREQVWTSDFPDTTLTGALYDRKPGRSGIDVDLTSTIFFYALNFGFAGNILNNSLPNIADEGGNNGSVVHLPFEGLNSIDPAQFDALPIACQMTATTFNTTILWANNTADLTSQPSRPLRTNHTWQRYTPRPAGNNTFEFNWSNIFTPLSAPIATQPASNSSLIPNYHPMTTLESYMGTLITRTPDLSALEMALENITAIAYWGVMRDNANTDLQDGVVANPIFGVARWDPVPLFLSLAASVALLLITGLLYALERRAP
ncbi:hypothetical protein EXIGLDRAFT_726692 [Exidia glandulosa HHB12029]|uniref:Uncharacterized protein n=1 Tax=Exidia glandulosa HHB12029 TaxID=1314781 RepID=A0A165DLB1_EXIGL|nr:hypothetical protein EXIGLDRAFT_726692 [Exidia glandulosa HHB12029]